MLKEHTLMKIVFKIVFLLAISASVHSQITLDRAINAAAQELAAKLEPESILAVVNFDSESEDMAVFVIDEMIRSLVQTRIFTVVERKNIDLARQELNFQMSGEVSDETFQGIGKMLGAKSIITGSIRKVGRVYRFSIRSIDVSTVQIEATYAVNIANDRTTAALMGGSADLFGLDDFTPLERSGAFTLNLIPLVSLGSWLMYDYKGAFISSGIQLAGFTLAVLSAVFGSPPEDDPRFRNPDGSFNEEKYDAEPISPLGMTGIVVGSCMIAGGYVLNLVRPYHVHKTQAKDQNITISNFSFSFNPGASSFKTEILFKMPL
jgi:TolB-like protein